MVNSSPSKISVEAFAIPPPPFPPQPPSWRRYLGGEMVECWLVVACMFVLNIAISNCTKIIYMKGFQYPLMLTCLHMVFSWAACALYNPSKKEGGGEGGRPSLSRTQLVRCVGPLSLCFATSVAMGNLSIKFIYPSFAQMLATASPLAVLVLQVVFTSTRFNLWTYLSVPIISLGLVMCSATEVHFNIWGVVFSIGATCFRGAKTIIQKQLLAKKRPSYSALPQSLERKEEVKPDVEEGLPPLNSISLLYFMAPQAALLLLFASLLVEGSAPFAALSSSAPEVLVWILLNCANACLLNLSNFVTSQFVSPITMQLLGNVKTVLGIVISAMIFSNPVTVLQGLGCLLALLGVYIYQKMGRSFEEKKAKMTPEIGRGDQERGEEMRERSSG